MRHGPRNGLQKRGASGDGVTLVLEMKHGQGPTIQRAKSGAKATVRRGQVCSNLVRQGQ